MKYAFEVFLSVLDIVIILVALIVFTGIFSVIDNYFRFIFMFLDFYCCISLVLSIEDFIELIKEIKNNRNNNTILEDIYE